MNRWREKSVVIAALVLGGSPGARAADEACRIGDGQRIILQLADEKTSLNKAKGTKVENESDNYHVRISIGGMPAYSVQVDTGSMGIVVSRSAVPDALWNAASDRPGQMYYSSSDRLMLGRYVTAPVKLGVPRDYKGAESGGDYPTTASIDVLAVECSCHTHPQTTGSSSTSAQEPLTGESLSCKQLEGTSAQLGGKSATLNRCVPARTGMMGVGFARGGHLSSAKNPFLRLEAMDKGLMHPGYIIRGRAHELELGLTKNGTADFKFVQLQLQSQAGSEPPSSNPGPGTLRYVKEWEAPRACVDFPGQKSEYRQFCGTLLMDTGIDEMLLTVPGNMRPPNLVTVATMDKVSQSVVPAGTKMGVSVPGSGEPILRYEFTVGSKKSSWAPRYVSWRGGSGSAGEATQGTPADVHINTGRRALSAADYAYDAQCGQVGFSSPVLRKK